MSAPTRPVSSASTASTSAASASVRRAPTLASSRYEFFPSPTPTTTPTPTRTREHIPLLSPPTNTPRPTRPRLVQQENQDTLTFDPPSTVAPVNVPNESEAKWKRTTGRREEESESIACNRHWSCTLRACFRTVSWHHGSSWFDFGNGSGLRLRKTIGGMGRYPSAIDDNFRASRGTANGGAFLSLLFSPFLVRDV